MKKIKKKNRKRKDPDAPKKIRIKKIKKRPNALIQYLKSIEPKYIPSYIAIVIFCYDLIGSFYWTYQLSHYGVTTVGYYEGIKEVRYGKRTKESMFYFFYVDGKKYRGSTFVTKDNHKKNYGDTLTVRYFPDNPKHNRSNSIHYLL